MDPFSTLYIIAGYFVLLLAISRVSGRHINFATFFTANRKSPWYIVSFGMIGASLSGVTFISVPGEVQNSNFYYFQMVLGYIPGYIIIATVLLPLYYRLNLVSIYTWLNKRFGVFSYKSGSVLFIVSKAIGAAFRLYIVANVLHISVFRAFNIPFIITFLIVLLLIWIYTFKAGIKTIVWTDTLQTLFMLSSVVVTFFIIKSDFQWDISTLIDKVSSHEYSKIFNWEWRSGRNFFKQFFAGAFMAIVMTGLDQDMMQKNLTCKSIKESQKNMIWLSLTLLPVNLLFMFLGVLLYIFASKNGIEVNQGDSLFSMVALHHLGKIGFIIFILGVIAAAFSSADSALTALTTSFCIDILNIDPQKGDENTTRLRRFIHFGFSIVLLLIIVIYKLVVDVFNIVEDDSVINAIFRVASYTYGPLLGLFFAGLFTKIKIKDKYTPIIALVSPFLTLGVNKLTVHFFHFDFGFLLLLVNGGITLLGLYLLRARQNKIT